MKLSYQGAGVDIAAADRAKEAMAAWVARGDERVLNRLGAFASLFEARFPGYSEPVLVLKTEEPGSKQKLALQHGRVASLCQDLIHHLVNDVAVMGGSPLSVQDAIICGRLEPAVVTAMVQALSEACRAQDCTLTGGETSEQPGVLEPGTYILTASVVAVAEKSQVIDGSRLAVGDRVLALPSSGLHTNGYSLVRKLLERDPALATRAVAGEPFLEAVLRPHRCYFQALRGLFPGGRLHGLAHITGGGLEGNVRRIVPRGLQVRLDLGRLRVLPVFRAVRDAAGADDAEMLRAFNLGAGMVAMVAPEDVQSVRAHLASAGCDSYEFGVVAAADESAEPVAFEGALAWS